VADRITGLELGADFVKPFPLGAPVPYYDGWTNGHFWHSQFWRHPCDKSEIDTNKRQVYKGDERIRLTGMEFSLLELLVSRSGAFSPEILQEVWGYT